MRSRKELADAIRILSMDAVDKAKSGHPGAPMGMADMAEALWRGVLRHNPADPHWANRDRFVLSNGHASMLLYSVLHLTGYDLSMDDIKNFRQLGSRTPGHPEKGVTPGVETTTGPLGQGFATAVGMAVAEKLLAAEFNRDGFPIVDHHTYVFLGDGCLMEGLSQEACSLAGTLGLGKLIVMYDDNGISIDGDVHQWFGDDTPARFEACGWHVISGVDGHDAAMLDAALVLARKETERPTLICCKTTIGYGSPKKGGTASSHGSPMGADENAAVRAALGWKDEPFVMPQDIKDAWDARERGAALEGEWKALFAAYAKAYPDLAAEFERRMSGALPADWESVSSSAIARFDADKPKVATRIANRDVLNAIAPHLPELFGGSADLTGSVGTWHEKAARIGRNDWNGNYLSYGVREFVMGTVMNGLALHGGFIPYGGTFLVFSDYARNAIRLSALMKQRLVWVLTHDSIGVGEDGPTHQPIEHVSSLRLIPDLLVWRPCDAVETAVAWKVALESAQPSCMVLTRQGLTPQIRTEEQLEAVKRGAYILKDCEGTPDVILIATGSEVQLAVSAAEALAARDWGATQAFFLTGGSTQGILAMLGAAVGRGGSVLIDREVHRSVCHGCALLDITPYFFSAPLLEPFGITGALRVEDAERQLLAHPDIRAVLLTSPTYYGLRRDLPAFADLCRAHGKLLLVDAAHGAHFPAVGLPSPVEEGADMAVLSMHKTMPCLGQAAVLLSGPGTDRASLRENTALFGTSSPSYPIMASIDLARAYNEGPGREKYQKAAAVCREMREYICAHTVFTALTERDFPSLDPCRLTVCTAGTDITGHALADALWSEHGVACEMADERSVVFILTESDTAGAIHRLRRGLRVLSRRRRETALPVETRPFPPAERVMSVRDARFAPSAEVSLSDAEGRVCARPVTPYPPGVPLLWPGEKITRAHVELIRERWYNDIDRITVVMPEK